MPKAPLLLEPLLEPLLLDPLELLELLLVLLPELDDELPLELDDEVLPELDEVLPELEVLPEELLDELLDELDEELPPSPPQAESSREAIASEQARVYLRFMSVPIRCSLRYGVACCDD